MLGASKGKSKMKEPETMVITHEGGMDNVMQYVKHLVKQHGWVKIDVITKGNEDKPRTNPQNRALHLYCERLAKALTEAGHEDMKTIIKAPISPTKEYVKKEMVHPVMKAMFPDKKSTADLSTVEMMNLYEQMNQFTSDRLGVSVPWPHYHESS
jgi:RNA-binding protein YhbY